MIIVIYLLAKMKETKRMGIPKEVKIQDSRKTNNSRRLWSYLTRIVIMKITICLRPPLEIITKKHWNSAIIAAKIVIIRLVMESQKRIVRRKMKAKRITIQWNVKLLLL